MTDLIRREDAARIAEDYNLDIWEYSTGNRSRIGSDPVAEAIRALPTVTVQAQIDAAREAALREAADMVETGAMHGGEDTQVLLDVRDAILALIRKGEQP